LAQFLLAEDYEVRRIDHVHVDPRTSSDKLSSNFTYLKSIGLVVPWFI